MHILEDVQEYLNDRNSGLSDARIKECHDLISNLASRVNTNDKQWVACEEDHEIRTVVDAIDDILNEQYSTSDISDAVTKTCEQFSSISHKPRIPFYVLVIDKLI
ncbi:MAG: hypothetical protein KAJ49_09600 [Arcobacteraceae bacterium]|nr:hypothetical protein [Arcobacteraceae bacterium]